jgi:uncharacterized glyoxalase superfamily protein PhnB
MTTRLWPNLGYGDAPAAIRFLVTAFGFEEVAVYPAGSADTIGHAMLRWPGGGFVTLHRQANRERLTRTIRTVRLAAPPHLRVR